MFLIIVAILPIDLLLYMNMISLNVVRVRGNKF